ncbi:hypothetical protein CSAL01_10635 [Colletotrichum salicis]|uniref:Uncharacterized protein n=1 Tax=Colletotrichum salicis TaxID=1209931 RepID=A0A135U6V9_9PEZI|nr:hypothetical protein CSAL01_10635 [Colletotrichum salicis]
MATPANVTFKNTNDRWGMNWGLCDSSEPMLILQGMPWLMRKLANWISVTVSIKTWTDPETSETRFLLQHTPPLGLPGMSEERALNYEPDEVAVPNLGKLRVRTRWGTVKELDHIDKYLARGLEKGPNSMIHMMTEHLDVGTVSHQIFGYEEIDGTRFHVRRIVVQKGNEVARLRLVYNHTGPRSS